ncbi:PAS domain-containing sensor histidine kinase [Legionella sp. W05-934-2]|jgi:two-component system sensor histidine kinase FlrB|uniref:sensor histidine kinase n=1 Tax=Legionella sp. W05-934-2 TaxID=1198649 RepID=UPI003462DE39
MLNDAILETMPFAVIWVNNHGKVDWLNAAAKLILGKDWQGSPWDAVMQHCFQQMQPDGLEVATQDGRLLQVSLSTIEDHPGQLITLVDVTPSRTLQRHLAHQRRLSAIGQMTAQLAHQLRTPLASAMLLTERLNTTTTEDKRQGLMEKLKQCHLSIERQIHDLLAYCRGEQLKKESIHLTDWFSQWQNHAKTYVHDNPVELICESLVDEHWQMIANAEALTGCLFNLLDNALQAKASYIKIKVYPIWDTLIAIDIEDNGCGMPKSMLEKVCDPFFTTKAKGTGLGLAIVESIIHQHAGTVTIDSTPDIGTTIRLILPVSHHTGKEYAANINC